MTKKVGRMVTLVAAAGLSLSGCKNTTKEDIDYNTQCKIMNVTSDTKDLVEQTTFTVSCSDGDKVIEIGIKEKYDEGNLDIKSVYPKENAEVNLTLVGNLSENDINIITQDLEGNISEFDGEQTVGESYDGEQTVGESYDGEQTVGESYDGEQTVGESYDGEQY